MIVSLQLMVDVVLSFFFHLSSSLHFKFPMNTHTSSHHELMFSKGLHVKNLALNLVLLGREGNFKGQSVVQEACPGGGTGTLAPSCLFLSFLVAMRKAGLLSHQNVLSWLQPQSVDASDQGLKLLKLQSKINVFSYECNCRWYFVIAMKNQLTSFFILISPLQC